MLDDAKLEKVLAKIKRRKYKKHQIFGIDSSIYQEHELKLLLFHYQHKRNRCEKCGQEGFWNKKPLELFVYRKNKNPKDNRLENLVLMCPNCYSQSDSQKVWIKMKQGKMGCCVDCGKKFRKPKVKKIVDPCADIGSESSNYIDTRPKIKKGGEERTRCARCLEEQIQKKDYTKLNKIKKEVSQHFQIKLDITQNIDESRSTSTPEVIQDLVEQIENKNLLSDDDSGNDTPERNKIRFITL